MAHWKAYWWTPDEWLAEADRREQQQPMGGGGGGGMTPPMFAAADPSTDHSDRPKTWPAQLD